MLSSFVLWGFTSASQGGAASGQSYLDSPPLELWDQPCIGSHFRYICVVAQGERRLPGIIRLALTAWPSATEERKPRGWQVRL